MTKMMTLVDHPPEVLAWRTEQFKQMGFDDTAAICLTMTRADIHDVRDKLLAKGCSHDLVVRIMAETDEEYINEG